ncbi:hypothetical protein FB45DRAFT_1004573 [Roridomyces roridus]|uniref:F-box domain-containing protein n=1 Tax=Roridomyces roridus TaxID=1738132 RepID=A0AAD7FIX3_9AGAR|nr:hypothetical protein FB45DRAFT_1004573 [Roridomyces roridus]
MSLATNAQLRARLSEVQSKIVELETQLFLLHREEASLRTALHSVVYPVLTLPDDTTTEIFQRYLGSPLVLASVCKQWRAVALSCPRLWPAIAGPLPAHARILANLLRSRLSRVGSLPFRIDATLSTTGEEFAILTPYLAQLLNLRLYVSGPIAFPGEVLLSSLQELALEHRGNFMGQTDWRITLPITPRLRILHLSHMRSSQISVPWSQLTDLTLYGQTIREALVILQLTANLVTLHARLQPQADISTGLVELRHLRTISTLSFGVLKHIKTPLLSDLEIRNFSTAAVPVVRDLISRSGCPIHKLLLKSPPHSGSTLWDAQECISFMPTIRALTLSGVPCDPGDWEDMLQHIGERDILPELESLNVTDCRTSISIHSIAAMLAKRAEGPGTIRSFQYTEERGNWRDEDAERALLELRELRGRGVNIEIGWGPQWYRNLAVL